MSDPHTEIREAPASVIRRGIDSLRWLLNNVHNMHSTTWKDFLQASYADADAALTALARLEREAAERETALERAELQRKTHVRMLDEAFARVREVEAERDRLDEEFQAAYDLKEKAEATVARQAETLGDLIEYAARRDREKHSYAESASYVEAAPIRLARAVLASPEAPAAEPPREQCRATSGTYRCERWAGHEGQHEGFPDAVWGPPEPAALPAVDAPPEPTT